MDNFDLKKYLANNPLLNEGLSNQEQDIIDDILSVTEGLNDILDKMKLYSKKGLLTLAIVTSVVGQLKAQGQTDLANQVEKTSTELVTTSKSKSEEFGIIMPFRKLKKEIDFNSEAGKYWQSQTWKKSHSTNQPENNQVIINGVNYKIVRYYMPSGEENIIKIEFTSKGQLNPDLSFFAIFSPEERPKLVRTPPTSEEQIKSYEDMGYVVKQTTRAGDRSIVIMGNDEGKYISLSFTKGKLVSKTTANYGN